MAGRGIKGDYRYGYQGSELDNEVAGSGNSYTTEFRELDPRLGRWFSVDPVFQPWQSPYTSMDNNPVNLIDPLGLEGEGQASDDEKTISYDGEEYTLTPIPSSELDDLPQSGWLDEIDELPGASIYTDESGNIQYYKKGGRTYKVEQKPVNSNSNSPDNQKNEQEEAKLPKTDKVDDSVEENDQVENDESKSEKPKGGLKETTKETIKETNKLKTNENDGQPQDESDDKPKMKDVLIVEYIVKTSGEDSEGERTRMRREAEKFVEKHKPDFPPNTVFVTDEKKWDFNQSSNSCGAGREVEIVNTQAGQVPIED